LKEREREREREREIGHAEKQVRNQLIDCQQLQQWQIVFTIFQMYFKQQEAHGVPVESRSERLGKLLWVFSLSLSAHEPIVLLVPNSSISFGTTTSARFCRETISWTVCGRFSPSQSSFFPLQQQTNATTQA
jgi:hypothetical protein